MQLLRNAIRYAGAVLRTANAWSPVVRPVGWFPRVVGYRTYRDINLIDRMFSLTASGLPRSSSFLITRPHSISATDSPSVPGFRTVDAFSATLLLRRDIAGALPPVYPVKAFFSRVEAGRCGRVPSPLHRVRAVSF